MLTKRSNILFEEELWDKLSLLAEEEDTSVSELIRNAARKMYAKKAEKISAKNAFKNISEIRTKSKGKTNYQELIDHGRKI